jgi:hypothetical protein
MRCGRPGRFFPGLRRCPYDFERWRRRVAPGERFRAEWHIAQRRQLRSLEVHGRRDDDKPPVADFARPDVNVEQTCGTPCGSYLKDTAADLIDILAQWVSEICACSGATG